MLRTVVASVLFSCLAYGWPDNDFNGISHVALVVNNLDEATKFYTDLGGMLVNKLSTGMYFIFWRTFYRRTLYTFWLSLPSAYVVCRNLMFSVVFVCQSVCPRGSPCDRCMGLHIPLSHGQLGLSEDLLKFLGPTPIYRQVGSWPSTERPSSCKSTQTFSRWYLGRFALLSTLPNSATGHKEQQWC